MKEILTALAPDLVAYPLFLAIGELMLILFFGGIFFNELWGVLHGYKRH